MRYEEIAKQKQVKRYQIFIWGSSIVFYNCCSTKQYSLYEAMMGNGVQGEIHNYKSGGHGYGLWRTAGTESTWPKACEDCMIMNGVIPFTTD